MADNRSPPPQHHSWGHLVDSSSLSPPLSPRRILESHHAIAACFVNRLKMFSSSGSGKKPPPQVRPPYCVSHIPANLDFATQSRRWFKLVGPATVPSTSSPRPPATSLFLLSPSCIPVTGFPRGTRANRLVCLSVLDRSEYVDNSTANPARLLYCLLMPRFAALPRLSGRPLNATPRPRRRLETPAW